MAIVCGNEQATKSFARTCSQSSRGLGACMKQPLTSPIVDLDNHTQGFNDIDDVAPSQAPTNDTPISSTSKAKEGKKGEKRIKEEEEITRNIEHQLGGIANALNHL